MLQPPEHKWHQDTTSWRSSSSRRKWTHTTGETHPISTINRNSPLCFNWNTPRHSFRSNKIIKIINLQVISTMKSSWDILLLLTSWQIDAALCSLQQMVNQGASEQSISWACVTHCLIMTAVSDTCQKAPPSGFLTSLLERVLVLAIGTSWSASRARLWVTGFCGDPPELGDCIGEHQQN